MTTHHPTRAAAAADCLAGGGRMGALIRGVDWSLTPLGPVEDWPQSLRTAVSIMLASGFPMLVVWGRDYIQLYNDAYRPVLGAMKHPAAVGQRARDCWPEIWEQVLGPMFGHVMAGGEPIWREDLAFHLDRNGYLEETFFTFSYSAIRDESGRPGGVLVTCVETTDRVLGERRLETLRELAAHASSAPTIVEACLSAARTLDRNTHDVPFSLIYLLEADGTRARLAGRSGLERGHPAAPEAIYPADGDAVWPIARAISAGGVVIESGIAARAGACPGGPWPEPADAAAIVPIAPAGQHAAVGALIVGISPRRAFDARYRAFVELAASHIATAVGNARAHEAERERAEALAEIDRAKTAFFSNVSHEFRTPLTLMRGPIEDLLGGGAGPLTDAQRHQLEILERNSARLLKLVNALLDFSRIEAGRARASYRPTDIAALTRDLAGAFRSVIEHAGLTFEVACEPIAEPVYVDRDMWEKVVLNLLSNAFKFTLEGTIALHLRPRGGFVELSVRDTGVGIPAHEQSRVFERFHRVEHQRARTYEGSGIGLALTHDLVALHGGTIALDSRPGHGSVFTVRIPTGCAHLPLDRVASSPAAGAGSAGAAPFVAEAARWLPERRTHGRAHAAPAPAPERQTDGRVLVVDDNADMRAYLRNLLDDWIVETAADGVSALELARARPPDLILTDVMMPGLDGFGLLRELRVDDRTRLVPILMLSARAGEEARVSGLAAGADDYVVKPFNARELVARVRSLVALGRARRDAELQKRHLHALFMQAPTPIVILRGPQHVIELANAMTCRIWGRGEAEVLGRPLLEALPELQGQPFGPLLDRVYQTGEPYIGKETPARLARSSGGPMETIFLNFVYAPMRGLDGRIEGVLVFAFDVSDEVNARDEMNVLRAGAEAANRTKDEFLAMLGHELRNPLAPILTALQLMALRGDAASARERSVIDRQVRHLVRLVDDLLDVSRIARGKIELRRQPLDVADIVASAIEATSPLLEERRHRLTVDAPGRGLLVMGDATRLTQAVTNVVTNAAKYTEPGGSIHVGVGRTTDGAIEIRVRDTGVGIAPDLLPAIFDMFTQGRQTPERAHGGLGLGLTIVRSLVELHHGTVAARSEGVGKGSEFVIRLPAIEVTDGASAAAAAPDPSTGRPPRTGRRVLVVDDNLDAAHLMSEALQADGYETRVAYDGPSALLAADEFRPHAVLLDIGLPIMDGYAVAAALRQMNDGSVPRLVAVTGYGQVTDQARTRDAGFDAHLVKPVDVDVLAAVLDGVLAAPPPAL